MFFGAHVLGTIRFESCHNEVTSQIIVPSTLFLSSHVDPPRGSRRLAEGFSNSTHDTKIDVTAAYPPFTKLLLREAKLEFAPTTDMLFTAATPK